MPFFVTDDDEEWATAEEAIAHVESAGSGTVVKFITERNIPNRLPEFVQRSIAMWSFMGGVWRTHCIFDGYGAPYAEEKPD